MLLESKLKEVFANNFLAYYSSHQNHINITGRNFHSDHELLGEIYEDMQDQIDPLGEFLRTIGSRAPATITEILELATIGEATAEDADSRLRVVLEEQEFMMNQYKELFDIATYATDQDIANFAADRLRAHAKWKWQLESTVGDL